MHMTAYTSELEQVALNVVITQPLVDGELWEAADRANRVNCRYFVQPNINIWVVLSLAADETLGSSRKLL